MLKNDYPKAIADLLGIPTIVGKGGPWMSTQGTVLGDWVKAVAEALDVPYKGKVPTMRLLVEAVGQEWKDATMASTDTDSGGGGNISKPGFMALHKGLETQTAAVQRRKANADGPAFPAPVPPDAADDRLSMRAIRDRRGQPQFRSNLLSAYNYRCAFSGCNAVAALEAAHITPYGAGGTYASSNGLLLRADLHTLFDLHLVAVDVDTRKLLLHKELSDTSYESELAERRFTPATGADAPKREALEAHRQRCGL